MRRYKVECAYTHKDWNGKEARCTEGFFSHTPDEAERECMEYIEREGYEVTRIIGTWVETDNYWASV